MQRRLSRTILSLFGIASCLLLLTTTQRVLIGWTQPAPAQTRIEFFVADAANYYFWAVASFPIYWIAVWLTLKNTNRAILFVVHVMLAFLFGLLNIVLQSAIVSVSFDHSLLKMIEANFYAKLAMRIAFYFLIAIGCSVLLEFRRRREEEIKARELENRLALAQFQVLKSQLSPQFLFEIMQSISDRMAKDIEEADRLTVRLGDFLRLSLESSCAGYVALQDEIELVKSYTDIRHFDHPGLQMSVSLGPDVFGTPVPGRILLDVIQSQAPTQKFELAGVIEKEHLVLSIGGITCADFQETHSHSAQAPAWRREKGKLVARIPLLMNVESENFGEETFFQSLEEFHRSIARKEKRIQNSTPSPRRRFWVALGVWTLASMFFLSSEIIAHVVNHQPLQVIQTLKESLAWYWWAIFTPVIFFLARRFPLKSDSLKKSVSAHLLFSFMISFLMVFLYLFQRWIFHQNDTSGIVRSILLGYPYIFDALMYWGIVGVHEGLIQRWEYLKEDARTARLQGSLMEAQVQALKMQLHPHFLFNVLNSISELMHEDVQAAQEMLKRLKDFLRLTFQSSDVPEITLGKELDYLRNYLEIQQIRFQNRLHIQLEIEPDAMLDRVPNLILQPIVENAIQHGVSPRIDSGTVEIRAFHREGNLFLEVQDDGPGLPSGSFREGIGMSNTRMRLKQIYGKDCRFGVQNNPNGGLVVTLQIPSTEMREHGRRH